MKLEMRQSLIILIIEIEVALLSACNNSDSHQIPLYTRNFTVTQRLDHFNKSDTRLWKQRYFINGEYYMEDGPVFVFVSQNDVESIVLSNRYQIVTYAKRYNALCLFVELRFGGNSQPTEDLSLDSLKYFTLDQALEDLVEFRALIEYKYKLNNKQWIFFGSGKGGLLATNLRIKYPILADGVVASCTRMTFKLDSSEITDVAFKLLEKTDPKCVPAIASAVKQIEAYIEDGPTGWVELSNKFKVCGVLNGSNHKEVQDFYYFLTKIIYKIVAGSADEGGPVTVESLCEIMNNNMKGPEIDRLAQIIRLYLESKNSDCSYERYENFVQLTKDTSLYSLYKKTRLNWYNLCTEQPYFYIPSDPKMPFHSNISLPFLIERCAEIFGPKFDINFINSSINATNSNFGYKTITDQLTNILFVNGAEDPELPLQISTNVNFDVKAIVIQGESHCTDTFPSRIYDSKELIKARLTITHKIGNWING